MTSRNAYTALTPEVSDFDRGITSPGDSTSGSTFVPAAPTPWRRAVRRTGEVLADNTGLLLVAGSQGFFSVANVAVKKLNNLDPPVPTIQLVLVRMSITWICSVVYMTIAKVPDPFLGPKGVRLLLVLRGCAGFFGLFGTYYSLKYLSLSDATVLTFLAPICTGIVGSLILKEAFTLKEALAGICSLIGVVLIARPPFLFGTTAVPVTSPADGMVPDDLAETATTAQRLGAVGVALMGVMGATVVYTTLRAIGKRAHPLHSLTSFSSMCVAVASAGIILFRVELVIPTRLDWIAMFIMIGLFGFFAQIMLVMGLQRETAGRATMGVYLQIVFATILERIFFHPSFSILSLIGTVVIMVSAIYVALTKRKESPNDGAGRRVAVEEDLALEEGLLENRESDDDTVAVASPSKDLGDKAEVAVADTLDDAVELEETPMRKAS